MVGAMFQFTSWGRMGMGHSSQLLIFFKLSGWKGPRATFRSGYELIPLRGYELIPLPAQEPSMLRTGFALRTVSPPTHLLAQVLFFIQPQLLLPAPLISCGWETLSPVDGSMTQPLAQPWVKQPLEWQNNGFEDLSQVSMHPSD